MDHLADTNAAARWALPDDPKHALARDAVLVLRDAGHTVCITPQVMAEFHALATRPATANGLSMSCQEARIKEREMEATFAMLPDIPAVYAHWCSLVDGHAVVGRQVYDARLVAVMLAHGVSRLLTLDASHFDRFTEITVVRPGELVAGPSP